jgi:hypothetical protein
MYDKADRKKVREEVSKRIADDFSLHALSTNDGGCGQIEDGCQLGLARACCKGAAIGVREAMVERQADDATASIERSAESSDCGQTWR